MGTITLYFKFIFFLKCSSLPILNLCEMFALYKTVLINSNIVKDSIENCSFYSVTPDVLNNLYPDMVSEKILSRISHE